MRHLHTLEKSVSAWIRCEVADKAAAALNGGSLLCYPCGLGLQDASPLENHHISAAYKMAHADEKLSFAAPMPKQDESILRASCIELVLSTDMKKHFSVVSRFQVRIGLPKMMIQIGFHK